LLRDQAAVVSQDETEGGLRAILNFGHTIGHAIENSVGYGKYLHGEALAMGQVAAAKLSARLLGLPEEEAERVRTLLDRAGLPTHIKFTAAQRHRLVKAMELDKKVSNGEIKFVLAERIGKARWGQQVPQSLLARTLDASLSTAH
jgi:3-dehydroquinate synthase